MVMEMFEKGYVDENYVRVSRDELFSFVVKVLTKLGVSKEDAKIVADNLIMAYLRGIESHGVQRLKRYVDGILSGGINLKPNIRILGKDFLMRWLMVMRGWVKLLVIRR